jgi:hypothetical protein
VHVRNALAVTLDRELRRGEVIEFAVERLPAEGGAPDGATDVPLRAARLGGLDLVT